MAKGDIERLRPWISEPWMQERILAAARTLPQPFVLRELIQATGLPRYVVHQRLGRFVKKGILKRGQARMMCRFGTAVQRPRTVYLYSFVERGE